MVNVDIKMEVYVINTAIIQFLLFCLKIKSIDKYNVMILIKQEYGFFKKQSLNNAIVPVIRTKIIVFLKLDFIDRVAVTTLEYKKTSIKVNKTVKKLLIILLGVVRICIRFIV